MREARAGAVLRTWEAEGAVGIGFRGGVLGACLGRGVGAGDGSRKGGGNRGGNGDTGVGESAVVVAAGWGCGGI